MVFKTIRHFLCQQVPQHISVVVALFRDLEMGNYCSWQWFTVVAGVYNEFEYGSPTLKIAFCKHENRPNVLSADFFEPVKFK